MEKKRLSRRLTLALLTPVLVLIAVGSVLAHQVLRMAEDARWVDHTDAVIAKAHDVQAQMLDQETAFRGFLLSGDRLFLEPYENARPVQQLAELRSLVSDNPEQVARVEELRRRYGAWARLVDPYTRGSDVAVARGRESMLQRRVQMDRIREAMRNILDAETELRKTRAEVSLASVARTRILLVSLLAGAALVLAVVSRRQLQAIAVTFGKALDGERETRRAMTDEQWIRAGQIQLATELQGDVSLEQLAERALGTLVRYTGAGVAAFFSADGVSFVRRAGYALDPRVAGSERFNLGEGLVGQCAVEKRVLRVHDVERGRLKLRSATSDAEPCELVIVPALVDSSVHAVLELGFLRQTDERTLELLSRIGESVALAVRSADYKQRLRELLEESQRQAEELQTQQEELRVANEELQEQSSALREAHAQLEERQHELETTNSRLEEQAHALQLAEREVSAKAIEVERASRYKSQFLANMSHELRTPLNSSLILAKLLADNKDGNLSEEQVRFAQTIYSAGNDLLALINDILDLSKIEAGKLDLHVAITPLARLKDGLRRMFEPLARDKGIALEIEVADDVPRTIESDPQRLEQVLKNLLSNAIKFTERGTVALRISQRGSDIFFEVQDTGIGIPEDRQGVIFEAFRQLDGASNRKYAGTGLGLAISRDLAELLGGQIELRSKPGEGSTFTLKIPIVYRAPDAPARSETSSSRPRPSSPAPRPVDARPSRPPPEPKPAFADDRERLDRARRLVLVIEDDVAFARLLCELAHELDFQCVVAHEAEAGFALATRYVPSAIVLDVHLPDHSGLSVLDRLKSNAATRHIPVHVVSVEDYAQAALSMGAIGYMSKPVAREQLLGALKKLEERLTRDMRRLLIIEDDARQRDSLIHLLQGDRVEITAVGTVADALSALGQGTFDCIVTDLTLPDASGFELLERIAEDEAFAFPPVIVYTARSLSAEEEQRLRKYASSIVVKGARSPERLVDEVTLFLHQVESELPPERQRMLKRARDREAVFENRTILIVEDDVRNIFALSSVLEPRGAKVVIARNGREALDVLERTPNVDLVLMDIMMPEMDGLEATRELRKLPKWAKLPVIALTAKAMRDDQEACLRAGANDYIAKPLDIEVLLSLLRVWMPK